MDPQIEKDLEYFRDYIFPDLALGTRVLLQGHPNRVIKPEDYIGMITDTDTDPDGTNWYCVWFVSGSYRWYRAAEFHQTFCC